MTNPTDEKEKRPAMHLYDIEQSIEDWANELERQGLPRMVGMAPGFRAGERFARNKWQEHYESKLAEAQAKVEKLESAIKNHVETWTPFLDSEIKLQQAIDDAREKK